MSTSVKICLLLFAMAIAVANFVAASQKLNYEVCKDKKIVFDYSNCCAAHKMKFKVDDSGKLCCYEDFRDFDGHF